MEAGCRLDDRGAGLREIGKKTGARGRASMYSWAQPGRQNGAGRESPVGRIARCEANLR